MNRKSFKEPGIPKELTVVEDAAAFMKEAEEQETEIIKRQFEGVFLTKFDMSRISFKQVVFKNCRLMGCTFNEAEFTDVKFINCDFYNSSFSDAYFKCCSFQSCKAAGADFYGSSMNHVSFMDCHVPEAGFDAVRMSYVRAENTDFTESSFSRCRIMNADWNQVCFQKASFFKTLLKGMDFSQCDMSGIVISDGREELEGVIVNMCQAVELAKRLGIVVKECDSDKI